MPLGTRMSAQILVSHTILQEKDPGLLGEMAGFMTGARGA